MPTGKVRPADEAEIPENLPEQKTLFPLLPVIEGSLWKEMKDAESAGSNHAATEKQRSESKLEAKRIMDLLLKKHPFQMEDNRIILGGIVYEKGSGKIEIPAVVHYPTEGDDRHPAELELILCSVTGRSYETLFTTEARPLHLELLMHLGGYTKTPQAATFRVEVIVPDHDPIPIESLIRAAGSDTLPDHLLWEFSGSEFKHIYQPDMTGDFLICWHVHDSVLRISHKQIASGEIK